MSRRSRSSLSTSNLLAPTSNHRRTRSAADSRDKEAAPLAKHLGSPDRHTMSTQINAIRHARRAPIGASATTACWWHALAMTQLDVMEHEELTNKLTAWWLDIAPARQDELLVVPLPPVPWLDESIADAGLNAEDVQ